MTTARLITQLEEILAAEKRLVAESLKENEQEITALNKARLANRSETLDGGLTPAYTDFTIRKKELGPGSAAGFTRLNDLLSYTMNDKGDYFDSLELKTASETFDVVSTDPKRGEIEATYNKKGDYKAEVLGLTREDIEETRDIIFDTLKAKILLLMCA